MIRLTDEEMKSLISNDSFDREMWEYGEEYLDRVAKAQLKKVVEWLKEYNFGETKIAEDAINSAPYFIIPPREWQALLEEVK